MRPLLPFRTRLTVSGGLSADGSPGVREELRDMARRLATVGYYVLLPDLYYRAGRDTLFGPDVSIRGARSASACARCVPR